MNPEEIPVCDECIASEESDATRTCSVCARLYCKHSASKNNLFVCEDCGKGHEIKLEAVVRETRQPDAPLDSPPLLRRRLGIRYNLRGSLLNFIEWQILTGTEEELKNQEEEYRLAFNAIYGERIAKQLRVKKQKRDDVVKLYGVGKPSVSTQQAELDKKRKQTAAALKKCGTAQSVIDSIVSQIK